MPPIFYVKFINQNFTQPYNTINEWNGDVGTDDTEIKWQAICLEFSLLLVLNYDPFTSDIYIEICH